MGLFDDERNNGAVFYKEESPLEQLEDEYDGDTMQNLLFGVLLGVALLFFLSICWNQCASKEEDTYTKGGEDRKMVIAREIRPGIIVIQGTNEETLRIIEEYEAVRNNSGPVKTYSGMPTEYMTGNLPVTPSLVQQSTAQHDHYTQLIDFDNTNRPPPYAPQQ